MYDEDTATHFDEFRNFLQIKEQSDDDAITDYQINEKLNHGHQWRADRYSNGKKVTTVARLSYPLATKNKILPPNIQIRFQLKRHDDRFLLNVNKDAGAEDNEEYKFEICDIYLTAKLRMPSAEIFDSLTKHFLIGNDLARYEWLRGALVGPFFIPRGQQKEHNFTAFHQTCPHTVLIFMVEVDACQGDYGKNPFHFVNPEYKRFQVSCDGKQYPSSSGYVFGNSFTKDTDTNQAKSAFLDVYKVLNQELSPQNCGLDFKTWVEGATFLAVQISEAVPSNEYTLERKAGDTRFIFELVKPLEVDVYVFGYGVYDGLIMIDGASGVSKNYI